MSKHTPGPWVYDRNQETFTGADGKEVMTLGDCWPFGGDPNEWDAALIVASPDLLESLEGIIQAMRRPPTGPNGWHEFDISGAERAIAKARGLI